MGDKWQSCLSQILNFQLHLTTYFTFKKKIWVDDLELLTPLGIKKLQLGC